MVDKKWTSLLIAIVFIAVIIVMFPLILDGADSTLRDSQTDVATGVASSGTPNYSGTMSLSQPLYDDSVSYITSVSSSSGTDTPVASTFDSSTDILTVTGLSYTGTRTLTTAYQYDQTDSYTGLGAIVEIAPMILWISVIIGVGMSVFFAYRKLN